MTKKTTKEPETDIELEEQPKQNKYIELLDPKIPILRTFREKASGSHKHTQALVSMVDNVCAAINLEPDELVVAARYHDIGKIWAPHFFSENQSDENVHDNLDPMISYQLLTRHVSDSVIILVNNSFPMEIIKMVSEHHGTTVLKAIYEKALEIDPNTPPDVFRYKTDKPSNLESLILMLCDQIEAASRSIYVDQDKNVDPTTFVIGTYNKLLVDGQFNDVEVLLGNINKIQQALIADVAGNFHKRVEYKENEDLVP